MASLSHSILCGVIALALWMPLGWLVNRRLGFGRELSMPLAPIMGWATQSTAALALSSVTGFSNWVSLAAALIVAGVAFALSRHQHGIGADDQWEFKRSTETTAPKIGLALYALAALVACLPASAVLPKFADGGVALAGPIFDHAKVALIDEMLRNGAPPGNPFFAAGGGDGQVSYYYLWHFSAAEVARLCGADGWEADIGLSWFSGFASLMTMAGLALRFSERRLPGFLVLLFSMMGSVRPVLVGLFGEEPLHAFLKHGSGLAGWLFQTSWSPHHVAAAACVLLAVVLLAELAAAPSVQRSVILALLLAAGFESSVWVGGITLAICGTVTAAFLFFAADARQRPGFSVACVAAAMIAIVLSYPLLSSQISEGAARGGFPITIKPAPVLGVLFTPAWRAILDVPAYWLVLLPLEFPLVFFPGLIGLRALVRSTGIGQQTIAVRALAVFGLGSLCCSWLLLSKIGDNNDLAWRAILPGLLVLTIASAIAASTWMRALNVRRFALAAFFIAIAFVAAMPDTVRNVSGNLFGHPTEVASQFAQSPELWAAVRRQTDRLTRIANNPAYLQEATPWPVNISWALMADRRSCFAGNELAIAFADLPALKRQEASTLFLRVFDGSGSSEDVVRLYQDYGCRAAVLTPQDGAWNRDPFASTGLFRLAEAVDGKWRIYVAADTAVAPREGARVSR